MCISLIFTTFTRNGFRSNKYLLSYTRDARRNAERYSCSVRYSLTKIEKCLQILVKLHSVKFRENPLAFLELLNVDRQMSNAIGVFLQHLCVRAETMVTSV
jgi:hypothetical protein